MGNGQKYTFDEGGVAFYYFVATVVAMYVIPVSIKLLWGTVFPSGVGPKLGEKEHVNECQCDGCVAKRKKLARDKKAGKNFNVMLAVGWAVFAICIGLAVKNTKQDQKLFDPFEILSISTLSSDAQIRKAFKRLSLKYHPDKATPEKKAAHEKKFLEITRAYRALTDEVARKNWEEYGNPDGPKNFSLGIALPSWLVDTKINILVVLLYMLIFGVAMPLGVRRIWQRSKEYTRDNILHSSMQMFYKEMKEAMSVKKILEVICLADEFKLTIVDDVKLEVLREALLSAGLELPDYTKRPPSFKVAHLLLSGYVNRLIDDEGAREEAEKAVLKALRLINGIYQIAIAKKWPVVAMNCMSLSALFVQALPENSSPLLQLPYLKPDILKHCNTKKRTVKSVKDVIDMDEEDRKALFRDFDERQIKDIVTVARTMPLVLLRSAEFRMLGQDQINPGGLVTCLVRLELSTFGKLKDALASPNSPSSPTSQTQKTTEEEGPLSFEFDEDGNLLEGGRVKFTSQDEVNERLAPVHAPHFPVEKRPGWWVVLMTRNLSHMIAPPVRVNDLIDKKTVSFQFAAPPRAGKYPFTLLVRSDCLLGVDIQREVELTVVPGGNPGVSDASSQSEQSSDSEHDSLE